MEVLESMILLGELDAEKSNILDIADVYSCRPLHRTAQDHPDPAAIKLLVRYYPSLRLAKDTGGFIPLDHDINESPTVVSLMRELTAARRATIALRTTLLLCIKRGYVYVRRSKRHLTEAVSTCRSRLKC